MLVQIYLDTRDPFQTLLDLELSRLENIENEKSEKNDRAEKRALKENTEAELLKVYTISKARLFSAAIYAAATIDIELFSKFYDKDRKSNIELPSVAQERKLNRKVDHKFVFLKPEHTDYIQLRRGQMGVMLGKRFDSDREFVHMAIRFFASLSKANVARYVALSTKIHPTSKRHDKPAATKKKRKVK